MRTDRPPRRRGNRPARLNPPRDTGITLGSGGRGRSRRRPVSDTWLVPMVAIIAVFLLSGIALSAVAPGAPRRVAEVAAAATGAPELGRALENLDPPTPYFGTLRGQRLRLPVRPDDVTVLAFHQSSLPDALPVRSLLRRATLASAVKAAKAERAARAARRARASRSAGATATATATAVASPPPSATEPSSTADAGGVWTGSAITLWRSGRRGTPDTAIDCGARPGTPVFSPLDGTVMEIRPYKLYGKYDDIEIHIRPDAIDDVDLVVIHVTDPAVTEGQHVRAGVDRIAVVRRIAGMVSGLQLAEYTAEGGNHCHVQVNRIRKPDEVWQVGEDPPGTVRRD